MALEQVTETTIETVSGTFVDLANPKATHIKIDDIAWSLSRQSRFAGHTMCKIPYTIAQHTVMVSHAVEEGCTPGTELHARLMRHLDLKFPFEEVQEICTEERDIFTLHALMHDFSEAYIVDLPSPVKYLPEMRDAYREVERRFDDLIMKVFGVPFTEGTARIGEVVVKWADLLALQLEAYHFLPSRGRDWNIPLEPLSLSLIYNFRWPIPNEQAYLELLNRYKELRERL